MLKENNRIDYIKKCILEKYREIIFCMKKLQYYYETKDQIFVHAGVDEEAEDLWKIGTGDYFFVGKYPPTIGPFYKDIIAGHTSTGSILGDYEFSDVLFDGHNHYYIDGGTAKSGEIPILVLT
jgi:serine/threonine protein phosphatase 1